MEERIPELDLDQLDADLYRAWQQLEKRNYGAAETLVAKSWRQVRMFRLSLDDRHLPATTDRDPRALATKVLYAVRNRINRLPGGKTWRCWRRGYSCEWVYPYGWVPEAGCPEHD